MPEARTVGRYELHGVFASGGMARVHFGRLQGAAGFRRIVAIKRLHPAYARDPAFRAMLTDEARLVASVRHANVAAILDVIDEDEELSLVLEYVTGESLARLAAESRERGVPIPPAVAVSLAVGILHGLHAAHEATEASGAPLGLVHRDVSPQNVVVGVDGVPRVLDFGVAKALGRTQSTSHGEVKGKAAYMAPEQVRGEVLDRRADIFAAGIVVWELLTGRRLFEADSGAASMMQILDLSPSPPSEHSPGLPPELDRAVLCSLARDREARFPTAAAMADALEASLRPAPAAQVAAWMQELAGQTLRTRGEQVRQIEAAPPLSASSLSNAHLALDGDSFSSDLTERDLSASSPRRPRRISVLLVPLAVVAIVAGVFAARAVMASSPSAEAPPAPSASSLPPAAAADSAALPDAPASPAAAASVAQAPDPSASAAPSAAPSAASAAGRARPSARPAGRAHPPRSNNCTPPYTIGANGIHNIKPECL